MSKDFSTKHYAPRTYEKMREVLMYPTAQGPEIQYHMVRGGSSQRNITIWEPGTIGGEYIKTYGHYHVGKLDETYWIIFGEGIALLQKRAVDADGNPIDDEIEQVFAVHVKPGDHIYIPSEWGHLVVNISKTYFVTADDSPVNFDEANPVSMPGHADYEAVKKMQGFCYYVVEKDGKPTLVKNSKYKKVPDVQIIEAKDYPLKKSA
ncbi:MAG: glucose-6-phosphate isomerase family protein [Candidatus Levyibacteriota bacterium]|jgi:glucose-6-phosphate isomerase